MSLSIVYGLVCFISPMIFAPNPKYIRYKITYLKIWDFRLFFHLKNNNNHSYFTYTVQNIWKNIPVILFG